MNNVSDFTNRGTCASCHLIDRHANEGPGVAAPGFFGTDGRYTFDGQVEALKTPHLRNQYQKVGMFGMPNSPLIPTDDAFWAIRSAASDSTMTGRSPRSSTSSA